MSNLQKFNAKICLTASGTLIHQNKILLIKHKKLGIWLTPGGHIDPNETPQQTAVREFWEETSIRVRVKSHGFMPDSNRVEFLPAPLSCNLHWVCKENYEARKKNPESYKKIEKWKHGCEQHLDMRFLVEAVAGVEYKRNIEETDGIAWFTQSEAIKIVNQKMIVDEINFAFQNI